MTSITGIAEVSIRVHDLAKMQAFYRDVVGLEYLREGTDDDGSYVFFKVGEGDGADVQNLALFEETMVDYGPMTHMEPTVDPPHTTLHHIALRIALDRFEAEKARLADLGIEIIHPRTVAWMKAHMFYFRDPEGNVIEFKAYDASIE